MRKRVSVDQLRVGMYVDKLCGSWMEHPFWRPRFLLESAKDLERLQATTIREVWIDTERGHDVEAGAAAVSVAQAEPQVAEQLSQADQSEPVIGPVSMQDELQRAAAICMKSRQGAVCNVYDAITSNRPYKSGWDPAESIHMMADWSGKQFDPAVYQAFVKSVGIYPIGSLVRLDSGYLAVVVEQGCRSLTLPRVKRFYNLVSNVRVPHEVVDLSADDCHDKIVGREDPAAWPFGDLSALWSH